MYQFQVAMQLVIDHRTEPKSQTYQDHDLERGGVGELCWHLFHRLRLQEPSRDTQEDRGMPLRPAGGPWWGLQNLPKPL